MLWITAHLELSFQNTQTVNHLENARLKILSEDQIMHYTVYNYAELQLNYLLLFLSKKANTDQ